MSSTDDTVINPTLSQLIPLHPTASLPRLADLIRTHSKISPRHLVKATSTNMAAPATAVATRTPSSNSSLSTAASNSMVVNNSTTANSLATDNLGNMANNRIMLMEEATAWLLLEAEMTFGAN